MVRNLSHAAAVDSSTGKATVRRHERLSLVDGLVVGHMREQGLDYLYSFDSGFDDVPGTVRLASAENPFEPSNGR